MEDAHIYIYGEIYDWQSPEAKDWGAVSLSSVKEQWDAQKDSKPKNVIVHIHSPGGHVTEGYAIHDYIRSLGVNVITRNEGQVASIATIILLAGDDRIVTTNATTMIHNPWGMAAGESEDIKKYADRLEQMETQAAEFYAKKTKLSEEEARELMKKETWFDATEGLEKGFYTEIEEVMVAVAKIRTNNNPKNDIEMSKNKKKSKALKMLKDGINALTAIFADPTAKDVTTEDGDTIVFPDLEADETPAEGDSATVDGNAAEGSYTLPDGTVYEFTDGSLTTITEGEEEEEEETEEMSSEEAQAKIKKLEGQLASSKKNAGKWKAEAKKLKGQNEKAKAAVETAAKSLKKIKAKVESGGFNKKKKNPKSGNEPKDRPVLKEEAEA